jgi:hypothetical protein
MLQWKAIVPWPLLYHAWTVLTRNMIGWLDRQEWLVLT